MFEDTKNGRSRYVPVSDEILELTKNAIPFQSCYGAFRSAFGRCGFNVTVGQLAHILRHTFASHFIMNGGNIRTLQTILGHSTLQMTMRYTHLAPDYMNQAKELNPLESGKIMERIIEVKKNQLIKISNWLICKSLVGGSHAIRTHDHRIKSALKCHSTKANSNLIKNLPKIIPTKNDYKLLCR